jgi:hypothetical protein
MHLQINVLATVTTKEGAQTITAIRTYDDNTMATAVAKLWAGQASDAFALLETGEALPTKQAME